MARTATKKTTQTAASKPAVNTDKTNPASAPGTTDADVVPVGANGGGFSEPVYNEEDKARAAEAVGIKPAELLSLKAYPNGWVVVTVQGKKLRGAYHAD